MADRIQMTPEEKTKRQKERMDSFWNIFLFTKNGKIKSTLIVNSFCYSIFCLAVYIAAYLLLLDALEIALAGHMPVWMVNFLEGVVPAIAGTAICCVFHFVFREKRLVPAAYVWLLFYVLGAAIAILVGLPNEDRGVAFHMMMLFVPAPIVSGCALSAYLYLRHIKMHPQAPVEQLPVWKRR